MGLISIIIPVTDDATRLDRTILHTQYEAGLWPTEIVVVNALGPEVNQLASGEGVRVIDCPAGDRAGVLNCGAKAAKGDVLLFVAADSLVPRRFTESIWWAFRDERVVGGAFDYEFDTYPSVHGYNRHALTVVRLLNRIRFRWTGNFLIEQGIFIRRETYDAIVGFRNDRRLEDLYFSRAMKRRGRTAVLGPAMRISPRRFLRYGVLRQFVTDLTLLVTDGLGWQRQKAVDNFPRNNSQLIASSGVVKAET